MSDDETPASDESPETSASSTDDTTPPESAATDATLPETPAATPVATPAETPAAATTTEERAGVFVPRWVAFLVGGLVALLLVGGGGFALGRSTDDDHDRDRGEIVIRPGGPFAGGDEDGGSRGRPFPVPNRGNGNGNGNGPAVPGIPSVPGGEVLLGVAVESSTGDTTGAQVAQVVPGSPAQDAGLEVGDVITKVDGTDIADAGRLVAEIRSHEAGDQVTITYVRGGESNTTDVTLGGDSSSSASGSGSERSSSSTS
jgi:membrane-associated protease RseP (regulator of RpoE activity)